MKTSLTTSSFTRSAFSYLERMKKSFNTKNLEDVEKLAKELRKAWIEGRNIYVCGNGGSAANAIHIANDLHYGVGSCGPGRKIPGIKVEALTANTGVITCLANDTGYENIFSHQLEVKGRKGDIFIALSGSGNSANVTKALKTANKMEIQTFTIVAFDGGECKKLARTCIHFNIDDMQIAEDIQLLVGHLCMQWLNLNKPEKIPTLKNG